MPKAIFRTQSANAHEKHYYAPAGVKVEMRHSAHIDSNGRRFLAADKPVDVFNLIQSHKEECAIENIIRRAVEGDFYALNAAKGYFEDITNCPSSIAEAQQYIIDAKNKFEELPKEVKAKFEYNAEMYVAEMGNDPDSWIKKMGYADKIELQKKAEAAEAKFQGDLQKAVENLAGGIGTVVNNTGGETNE